jgi:hypothetical protein
MRLRHCDLILGDVLGVGWLAEKTYRHTDNTIHTLPPSPLPVSRLTDINAPQQTDPTPPGFRSANGFLSLVLDEWLHVLVDLHAQYHYPTSALATIMGSH